MKPYKGNPAPIAKFVYVAEDRERAEVVRKSRGLFPEQVVHVATQAELDAVDLTEIAGVVWLDEHIHLDFHEEPVHEVFDGDHATTAED